MGVITVEWEPTHKELADEFFGLCGVDRGKFLVQVARDSAIWVRDLEHVKEHWYKVGKSLKGEDGALAREMITNIYKGFSE
jgi:hypothetical protein